jgi:hypothetical protein
MKLLPKEVLQNNSDTFRLMRNNYERNKTGYDQGNRRKKELELKQNNAEKKQAKNSSGSLL